MLGPLLNLQLRPKLYNIFQQSRNVRPSIKIAKDKFQLKLDVQNFSRDEICVKARQEYVIIEGKQVKKTKQGVIMRQFVRKFRLPDGCSADSIESKLSPDGILTIVAPRKILEPSLPCETLIPISTGESMKDKDASFVPVKDSCAPYLNQGKANTELTTIEKNRPPK